MGKAYFLSRGSPSICGLHLCTTFGIPFTKYNFCCTEVWEPPGADTSSDRHWRCHMWWGLQCEDRRPQQGYTPGTTAAWLHRYWCEFSWKQIVRAL